MGLPPQPAEGYHRVSPVCTRGTLGQTQSLAYLLDQLSCHHTGHELKTRQSLPLQRGYSGLRHHHRHSEGPVRPHKAQVHYRTVALRRRISEHMDLLTCSRGPGRPVSRRVAAWNLGPLQQLKAVHPLPEQRGLAALQRFVPARATLPQGLEQTLGQHREGHQKAQGVKQSGNQTQQNTLCWNHIIREGQSHEGESVVIWMPGHPQHFHTLLS